MQPLHAHDHPMWARDAGGDELDDDAVESKVRSITSLRAADPCNVKCPVKPYGPDNPVPEVRFPCFVFCLLSFFCRIFLPDSNTLFADRVVRAMLVSLR